MTDTHFSDHQPPIERERTIGVTPITRTINLKLSGNLDNQFPLPTQKVMEQVAKLADSDHHAEIDSIIGHLTENFDGIYLLMEHAIEGRHIRLLSFPPREDMVGALYTIVRREERQGDTAGLFESFDFDYSRLCQALQAYSLFEGLERHAATLASEVAEKSGNQLLKSMAKVEPVAPSETYTQFHRALIRLANVDEAEERVAIGHEVIMLIRESYDELSKLSRMDEVYYEITAHPSSYDVEEMLGQLMKEPGYETLMCAQRSAAAVFEAVEVYRTYDLMIQLDNLYTNVGEPEEPTIEEHDAVGRELDCEIRERFSTNYQRLRALEGELKQSGIDFTIIVPPEETANQRLDHFMKTKERQYIEPLFSQLGQLHEAIYTYTVLVNLQKTKDILEQQLKG